MKIYVASSWRNIYQQDVVLYLRSLGHQVYDFKNPDKNDHGFHWSEIDKNWKNWNCQEYQNALKHPLAVKGFEKDFNAMLWADMCILTLPCGRSAHSEAGYMAGIGKNVYIYIPENIEPELMYKIYNGVFDDLKNLAKGLLI